MHCDKYLSFLPWLIFAHTQYIVFKNKLHHNIFCVFGRCFVMLLAKIHKILICGNLANPYFTSNSDILKKGDLSIVPNLFNLFKSYWQNTRYSVELFLQAQNIVFWHNQVNNGDIYENWRSYEAYASWLSRQGGVHHLYCRMQLQMSLLS